MARTRTVTAALAAALLALVPCAPALALRPLHVDALSMRADRTQVQIGEVFHLAIHARVKEPVAALDELVVPDVGTMQLLGDERHVTTSAAGTDVVETLTLEPKQSGAFTFNGAYLDAIDARSGKPSRFSANAVRVVVARPDGALWSTWIVRAQIAAIALAGTGLLVVVALLLTLRRARRRPVAAPPSEPVAGPPPRGRTARDEVADALHLYRTAPANASLTRLRGALFAAAGAAPGATLRDALAATPDAGLRRPLIAAERTAFAPAAARDASSAELVDATEEWLQ